MLVKAYSSAVSGIDAHIVTIEVNVSPGVRFFLVGLPDVAVKESQQRIESSLRYMNLKWPGKQVLINMAPADIKKEGSAFDLPLAVGILAANENLVKSELDEYIIMGELSLDGTLKPVKGVLSVALKAKEEGFTKLIVPVANAREAAVVSEIDVYGMNTLKEVVDHFNGMAQFEPLKIDVEELFKTRANLYDLDFLEVKGQESVKRAIEVAAAGGHNLIMLYTV